MSVQAPTIAECYASLECRVAEQVPRYGMFVLEVLRASVDRSRQPARTLHHRGWGEFAVAGETVRLPSGMR